MTLKFIDKSSGKVVEKPVRRLMINGVERYRLEVRKRDFHKIDSFSSNELIYAKGKINLDWNWPKDGSGKIHGGGGAPLLVYVFYKEEGFFYKDLWDDDKYLEYHWTPRGRSSYGSREKVKLLSQITEYYCVDERYFTLLNYSKKYLGFPEGTEFKGWYTAKTGGKKIETVDDINRNTNLFKYKSKNILPEITLYGHWELPVYTLRIHNISKRGAKSSFECYDEKTKKWIRTTSTFVFRKVLYGTNILSLINKWIKNPKYVTWAYNALDGTSKQQALRAGPQNFWGWCREKNLRVMNVYDERTAVHLLLKNKNQTKNDIDWVGGFWSDNDNNIIDIYPHFQPLVIYPKIELPNGEIYEGKYYCSPRNWRKGVPEEFADYERNYDGSNGFYGIVPIYEYQWWEYEVDGRTRYYQWRVDRTDDPEHRYSYSWGSDGTINCSSTTVMKFVRIE